MMRLLYPLIASALITIVPFLMTFENGQDIVRGIFGYSEFGLLLLFVWVKGFLCPPGNCRKNAVRSATLCMALALIFVAMVMVAFMDLQNLLAIKGWDTGWRIVVPFVTCGFAVTMVWKLTPFRFSTINLILFVALVVHLFAYNNYAAQPLAQFPVVDYLSRTAPKPVERKHLPESFAQRYKVLDEPSVTRDFIDSARSNVVVSVESWGIPLDENRFARELSLFDGLITSVGANKRMYSRTRTAERENLVFSMVRDSVTKLRDTTFIPQVLGNAGAETYFLFGGDSTELWRQKYVRQVGFRNVMWHETRSDAEMSVKLDSILGTAKPTGDSVQASSVKIFAAWTTRDTKFPLPELGGVYAGSADANDSAYTGRLMETLRLVADLARRHPDVRFVVQGDHEPILSPLKFQERFYKRWTPFIVLN